ncbi:pachytene checkpoint protein 2 homolog isoform X1 [Helianthus annuus]|uniref:pachytene checkpoint protein 2 homolog isoform X1 n=1 Tax=Helianthus annuus TaxID=4232 RepID=UPI000B8F787C|nr:pachytene checkpoint protein 2 homolog isoform X1 [Helianthus annuus]
MVEEENNLVFVLIDEVESLAAGRKAAISGSEPSDSIRGIRWLEQCTIQSLNYEIYAIILTSASYITKRFINTFPSIIFLIL